MGGLILIFIAFIMFYLTAFLVIPVVSGWIGYRIMLKAERSRKFFVVSGAVLIVGVVVGVYGKTQRALDGVDFFMWGIFISLIGISLMIGGECGRRDRMWDAEKEQKEQDEA